nr:MAG TPA_asm: Lower collar protein [Caudoviricetes sp.]
MVQSFSAYAMETPGEYTETLGNLIDMGYDTDTKLHLSANYYPIYDESHRAELNEKIIRHYALREIGQETAQMFVFYLGATMAEIMPYFNERYRTLDMEYNPLDSMDMTTDSENGSESQSSGRASSTQDSTSSSTSKSDNSSTTTSKSFDSDVPQTGVVGDFARYASHANESQADSSGTASSSQDSTSHTTAQSATDYQHDSSNSRGKSRVTGRSQSAMSLIQEYRNAIINVDMEIVRSLEPCFMQVWGSYDTIFSNCHNYGEWE